MFGGPWWTMVTIGRDWLVLVSLGIRIGVILEGCFAILNAHRVMACAPIRSKDGLPMP